MLVRACLFFALLIPAQGGLEPYSGISFGGKVMSGVFPLRSSGVSTKPVVVAAEKVLAGLSEDERKAVAFAVEDDHWRQWDNRSGMQKHGLSLYDLSAEKRELVLAMLKESLSAKGLERSRNIMRLDETLGELTGRPAYGEWRYRLSVFGTPSVTEPWGWQINGHHLNINYFVLGDQVVMTPTFMGTEPAVATTGKFAGTKALQDEQDRGLAFMRSLPAELQAKALLSSEKGLTNNVAEAYKDNVNLDFAGLKASSLNASQRNALLDLIREYVGNMRDGHAKVKMSEVEKHLDDTWFAWIGSTAVDGVFYYRIQSPVILIEFDHQQAAALRQNGPTRQHIHTVVRTPNGNDYGKDLLRQHHELHKH
ncbi:MAG: DUF3500 domain-containing protein [Fimbriimonas sp.]